MQSFNNEQLKTKNLLTKISTATKYQIIICNVQTIEIDIRFHTIQFFRDSNPKLVTHEICFVLYPQQINRRQLMLAEGIFEATLI